MTKRRVTVFDFDGTLTRDDTFISFSLFSLGSLRFMRGLILASPWLSGWKLGLISGSKTKRKLFSILYRGYKKEDIQFKALTFEPMFRKEVIEILKQRQGEGDKVYIISASLDLWMEEMGRRLDAEVICTQTENDGQEKLTGRFSTPNCHGEEKLKRLMEKEGDRTGFYLTVYGDEPSGGDAALFQEADEAIRIDKSRHCI